MIIEIYEKIFPVIIMLFASSSFAVADKHEAKFITKKEFIERNLKQLEQRFDQIDTNKDGKMTAEEEKAFVAKVKKQEQNVKPYSNSWMKTKMERLRLRKKKAFNGNG